MGSSGRPVLNMDVLVAMFRIPVILVIAISLIAPVGAGEAVESFAPAAAVAASVPSGVLVSWVPGEEVAEVYRLYGVLNDVLILLDEVVEPDHWSTFVEKGYVAYAVTGVQGAVESAPVFAEMPTDSCQVRYWMGHISIQCKPLPYYSTGPSSG